MIVSKYEKRIHLEFKKNNFNKPEENNNTTINLSNDKKVFLSEENETTKISKDQIKNITQAKPSFPSFDLKKISKIIGH